MNKLSRDNLQEFCRICLSSLRSMNQDVNVFAYNFKLMPNLAKLIILFTSLDLNEENEAFPKSLCQLCYDKMIDFQDFRKLALQSAEVLYGIVTGNGNEKTKIEFGSALQSSSNARSNSSGSYQRRRFSNMNNVAVAENEDDDDDQLLLPELAPLFEQPIKHEPIEMEETTVVQVALSAKSEELSIKNEIDSEYEEENSTFYENNALGTNYDSIGDDADDEEHALRNGAVNSSTASSTSTSRQRLNTALSKRERNKKSLKCPRCDKQVYKQVYLDAHIRGVHEGHQKPFLCLECQKAFTRYNQLHVHIQAQHLFEEKFTCEFDGCQATFKFNNTLETHRKVVHLDNTNPFSVGLQEVLELHQAQLTHEIEMDHICHQCFKKYSSKRALSEHLKRHAQIKEHVCKVCNVAKVTRTELQTHMRTHESNLEKFKCNICPQEFNHKNAISRHVRVVHEGQRRFPCSFCPKRFGTRNSQVCHERLHTGERPFTCEICQKGFAQLEGLKSHMKNHDKNLRKHVCSFCSQRFITRKNLIDHEERHRGDKPHICNMCSRGFFKPEDLQTHQKSHLEEEGDDDAVAEMEEDVSESSMQQSTHFERNTATIIGNTNGPAMLEEFGSSQSSN